MSRECPICCFEFSRLVRKKITCFNCQKSACASCVKRFILEGSSDAKCLHCNISWDRRFMIQNLTKTFCNNDYRDHRKELLFERNKVYYPRISEILDEKHNLEDLNKKKQEIARQYKEVVREMERKEREIVDLEVSFVMNEKSSSADKQVRNRHCITENCMGYLNRVGFCALCKHTTCLNCNVYKTEEEEHECKKEDVETWENLKKTTKPCPSCGVRVFKISGCDQMWCTHCNTAFSWKFERIETGAIHNPHYYDWLFNGGQDAPQIMEPNACQEDRLPPFGNIIDKLRKQNNEPIHQVRNRRCVRNLTYYHQQLNDLKHNIVPKLLQNRSRGQTLTNEQSYRFLLYPLLVNFMKGGNNKQQIERKDYQFQTDCELAQILLTFFREQVQFFYLFLNEETYNLYHLEKDTEKNRVFFTNAISTFEKEYKRTWRPRVRLPAYTYGSSH